VYPCVWIHLDRRRALEQDVQQVRRYCVEKLAMTFGKPGRPPEDRFARQCEIYAAVSPLLLTVGARQLSMRQAARVACRSVGGVYHYFPTKRALVLHGVQEVTLERLCHDYFQQLVPLAATNPQGYLDAYQAAMVRATLFVRPSVYAALTLGDAVFQSAVEATLSTSTAADVIG
jgi:AcrR family transcriptional regulator